MRETLTEYKPVIFETSIALAHNALGDAVIAKPARARALNKMALLVGDGKSVGDMAKEQVKNLPILHSGQ